MLNNNLNIKDLVPYHLVNTSPIALLLSINIYSIIIGIALSLLQYQSIAIFSYTVANKVTISSTELVSELVSDLVSITISIPVWILLVASLISLIFSIVIWIIDVSVEASYLGNHTTKVIFGINLGFILFIVSEIALFATLFWAYLDSALAPTVIIGSQNLATNIGLLPILASAILFSSSISITVSHNAFIGRHRNIAINYLIFTIIKGLYFSSIQLFEYYISPYNVADFILASVFYIATGLHGIHIIIGTLMLLISLYISQAYINTDSSHTGYKLSIIYWHFVDALWGIIYLLFYQWPALL